MARWQPVLLAIMHMIGLFDRPAGGDCLDALRAKPAIKGLTDQIVKLDDATGTAPPLSGGAGLLCATLTRYARRARRHPPSEWFGEHLPEDEIRRHGSGRMAALRALARRDRGRRCRRSRTSSRSPAIAHGCRAEFHKQALEGILITRISRGAENTQITHSARKEAILLRLLVLRKPYTTPISNVKDTHGGGC